MQNADRQATCFGTVRRVLGSTVTVALDPQLAGVAPIYRGRLQSIGQIGSIVRIPQGLIDVVATVTLVGIGESSSALPSASLRPADERWLEVQLLGEINHATGQFQRGVSSYPGLDDPVHFATPAELELIFPAPDSRHVRLGKLSAADNVPVSLDAAKFVVRHAAIVGSTGSGKTSAVASLLQAFVRDGWGAANIVVIDPHGEYASALGENASVRSVLPGNEDRLQVPYWALPAQDILRIFCGSLRSVTATNRFAELVTDARRQFAASVAWLNQDPATITSDTPIPFDIRPVWHRMDRENRETRTRTADEATACLVSPGDAVTLTPAQFTPYNPGGQVPNKGPLYQAYGVVPDLLRLGLLDTRLRFLREPEVPPGDSDPLVGIVQTWLGGNLPISVLNFSGVPAIAADAAIGVVLQLLLEIAFRCEVNGPGIGRPSPVLVVLEEAHRFLNESSSTMTHGVANRIAREGRKHGVGLLLVTQRPTELPPTTLAQCGTIIAMRLSNTEDQGVIRAALPDAVSGLAAVLPSLRTHEAIVCGDAIALPARTVIDAPSPWPRAADPSLDPWRREPQLPEIAAAITAWRHQA